MTQQERTMAKITAIIQARKHERSTGERHYIVWSVPDDFWIITKKMPMLGEWYDSDGVRHG